MSCSRLLRAGVLGIGLMGMGAAQAAGDPEQGRLKAQLCLGCHAIPGYTNAYPTYRVPRVGGQEPDYVVTALKAYASGERGHRTMRAQAATLSEQDMEDIAAYFWGVSE